MTDESSAMGQPYEIVSARRAKRPPGGGGSYWYRYVIAFEGTKHHSRLPTRGPQGRDEGGGGYCRPIERTALGALEQTQPRRLGTKEENPKVTIDHPSCRSYVLVAILQCLLSPPQVDIIICRIFPEPGGPETG